MNTSLRLALCAVILGSALVAQAAQGPYYTESISAQSGRKFMRGLTNVTTFWAEIPKEASRDWQNISPGIGLTVGAGRGTLKACQRFGVGIYEMVTFPWDTPACYQPTMYPETVMEDNYSWEAEKGYAKERWSKTKY
ncbi:exosortase system-associated protein, TIGR04073 family [Candidatus Sumerlaeota bacterium]|nr:exosortase system-associated protein, TIGR04073 family [Candidatus Sumerlaeales bacterium]NLD62248.1 exosortase system-associated protein, TIGR04073 family [Candidatus Sumerlaeota bacterium]